jgi:hypothetical protein
LKPLQALGTVLLFQQQQEFSGTCQRSDFFRANIELHYLEVGARTAGIKKKSFLQVFH